MRREEDALHIQAVHFLKIVCPGLLHFHAPNGGSRDVREAAKLKAMGVRPGVADLAIVGDEGRLHFIEFKALKGRQSPAQKQFQEDCAKRNIPYAIVRSLNEFEATLKGWGFKIGARE